MDLNNPGKPQVLDKLRNWENSNDINLIYQAISKNKKIIKENAKPFLMKQNQSIVILADNLINIIKEVTNFKISNTQWRMIVGIADRERNSMINFDLFLSLITNSSKLSSSHPKFK